MCRSRWSSDLVMVTYYKTPRHLCICKKKIPEMQYSFFLWRVRHLMNSALDEFWKYIRKKFGAVCIHGNVKNDPSKHRKMLPIKNTILVTSSTCSVHFAWIRVFLHFPPVLDSDKILVYRSALELETYWRKNRGDLHYSYFYKEGLSMLIEIVYL